MRVVEIPRFMRTNEKDHRGYPIPVIALRDRTKKPHFTINNDAMVSDCAKKKNCGICGKRMKTGFWFVGGARLIGDPFAAFLDPPMHRECAEYALKVCPYLANPSFGKEGKMILGKTLSPGNVPEDTKMVTVSTDTNTKPPLFALACAKSFQIHHQPQGGILMTSDEWLEVHYWKDGVEVEGQS